MKILIFFLIVILLSNCSTNNKKTQNFSEHEIMNLDNEITYDEYYEIINLISKDNDYPDINDIPLLNEK